MKKNKLKKISRAEKAGEQLGDSIIEMINLMYQDNTAKNFLNGIINCLKIEKDRRNGKPF